MHIGKSILFSLLAASVVGCQSAHVTHSLPQKTFANDADAQMDFWHGLATEKLTSNDEAFHGLLLYLDGKDDAKDYAGRVSALKSRGLLDKKFDRPSDEAVTRGALSVALCKILQYKGGLMMHVVGPVPRYACRELEYRGVYPTSSPQQTFTGTEFVGVIGKLDDTQHGVAAPVTERLKE
jgi:hypothetical protein